MKSKCCKKPISTKGKSGGFVIHCTECGQILDTPKGYKVFDLEVEVGGEDFEFTVLAKSKEQAKKMVKVKVL